MRLILERDEGKRVITFEEAHKILLDCLLDSYTGYYSVCEKDDIKNMIELLKDIDKSYNFKFNLVDLFELQKYLKDYDYYLEIEED